ncbi:MAG: hypothetical protein ACYSP9_07280, partial [Planctomycetota bacterium]
KFRVDKVWLAGLICVLAMLSVNAKVGSGDYLSPLAVAADTEANTSYIAENDNVHQPFAIKHLTIIIQRRNEKVIESVGHKIDHRTFNPHVQNWAECNGEPEHRTSNPTVE